MGDRLHPQDLTTLPADIREDIREYIQADGWTQGAGYTPAGELILIRQTATGEREAHILTELHIAQGVARWASQAVEYREEDTPAEHSLAALDIRAERWELLTLNAEIIESILRFSIEERQNSDIHELPKSNLA